MKATLNELVCQWKTWAETASKDEDGWESYFPAWDRLVTAATEVMQHGPLSVSALRDIELCWAISEEDEDLTDFAREHIDTCWSTLLQMAHSQDPTVRWQVYDVLGYAGQRAEALLRKALDDPDAYSRRRAILALARLRPSDAGLLARRFAADDDPYIRQAADVLSSS